MIKNVLQKAKKIGFSDSDDCRTIGSQQKKKFMIGVERKGIIPVYKMVDTCAAEFESETPYFYGTYEDENESIVTERESVIVLGQVQSESVKG